jgi:YD repeat-containing protein
LLFEGMIMRTDHFPIAVDSPRRRSAHSHRLTDCRSLAVFILATLVLVLAGTSGGAASDLSTAGKVSPFIRAVGFENNFIVLNRTHELSVFGADIGNQDNITDAYRVIPFHLTLPAKVLVDVLDAGKNVRAVLVRKQSVAAGSHFFVLTYDSVASRLKTRGRFYIRVEAHATGEMPAAGKNRVLETSGCLQDNLSGDVLGNMVVHDVLIQRGQLSLDRSDLELKGRGPSFGFSRTYHNQPVDRRLFNTMGQGWRHVYEKQLEIIAVGEDIQPYNLPQWVVQAQGRFMPLSALPSVAGRPRYVRVNGTHFKRIKNRWVASCTRHGALFERENVFEYVAKDGTIWGYEKPEPPESTPAVGQPPGAQGDLSGAGSNLLPDLRYGPPAAWPLMYVQDRNGNRMTLEYAQTPIGPVVTGVADAVGRKLTFEYQPDVRSRCRDQSDYLRKPVRLVRLLGPDGIELRFEYQPQTFLLERCQRDERVERYAYAPVNPADRELIPPMLRPYQLVRVRDANGHGTGYEYCTAKDIPPSVQQVVTALDPRQAIRRVVYADGSAAEFQYDPTSSNERVVVNLRGYPTRYLLNEYGNPLKQVEPLGKTTTRDWQLDNARNDILMMSRTDPMGLQEFFAYDHKGNVVRQWDSEGNVTENQWQLKSFDLVSQTYNGEQVLSKAYDDRGNLTSRIDADGVRADFEYDQFGQRTREAYADGRIVEYAYDRWGNLKSKRSASGVVTLYRYDVRGRLVSKSDSEGRHWAYVYDTLDRPVIVREPGKSLVRRVYDPKGNVLKETTTGKGAVTYEYDCRDRMVRILNGGKVSRITYDANSNILAVDRQGIAVERHQYNELDKEITSRKAVEGLELRYQDIMKGISDGITLPEQLADAPWDRRRDAFKAARLNRKGVYFYNRNDFALSLHYFKQAVELSNHSISFLRNCMHAYNEVKHYPEALAFLEKHWQPYMQDEPLRSWQAWFLRQTGRPREAVKVYARLFAEGYRNDEDFESYTDTLKELGMDAPLDKAFARYLKAGRSASILILQAKSLRERGKHGDALSVLNALQRGKPQDPKVAFEKIHNYFELEQYRKARGECRRLIGAGHASADAYYLKGKAEYRMQHLSEAKESLEKALSFTPDDRDIQEFIDQIAAQQGQGRNRGIKKVIAPVNMPAAVAEMLDEKAVVADAEESDAVYHYRVKCYRFRQGQPLTYTVHMKIQVLNATGVLQMNKLMMNFNPLYEDIHVNRLIVRNRQGAVIAEGDPDEYYVMDAHRDSMATYKQTLYVPVPQLSPGAIIEWTVTRRTKGACDRFPFEREALFGRRPIRLAGLYVEGDTRSIVYTVANTAPPSRLDGAWLWVERDLSAYSREPEEASYEMFRPVVRLSAAGQTWEKVGRVYYERIRKMLQPEDQTRRLARSLVASMKSPQAKIETLARFVQTELTYQGIEFGSRGVIPNSAAVTLHRKYGDCKDHAVLLYQLLTAAGLRAQLALVNTDAMIEPRLPSDDQFNHMIVCVSRGGGLQFIDATDKGMQLGLGAPNGLGGRRALLLSTGNSRLDTIPGYTPDQCRIRCRRVLSIENNEDLIVSEKVIFQGYPAADMRSFLYRLENSRRPEWLQKLISAYYPSARLNSVDFKNLGDTSADLVLETRYTIDGRWKNAEKSRSLTVPSPWEQYYLKIRPVWQRTAPFEIAYPIQFDTVVTLPRNSEFDAIDALSMPDGNARNQFCRWHLDLHKVSDDQRQMFFRLNLLTGVFPPADYPDYQTTMDSVLAAVNRGFSCHP